MDDELAKMAESVYTMYKNYRLAGFDNRQALKLASDFATAIINASTAQQTGDK